MAAIIVAATTVGSALLGFLGIIKMQKQKKEIVETKECYNALYDNAFNVRLLHKFNRKGNEVIMEANQDDLKKTFEEKKGFDPLDVHKSFNKVETEWNKCSMNMTVETYYNNLKFMFAKTNGEIKEGKTLKEATIFENYMKLVMKGDESYLSGLFQSCRSSDLDWFKGTLKNMNELITYLEKGTGTSRVIKIKSDLLKQFLQDRKWDNDIILNKCVRITTKNIKLHKFIDDFWADIQNKKVNDSVKIEKLNIEVTNKQRQILSLETELLTARNQKIPLNNSVTLPPQINGNNQNVAISELTKKLKSLDNLIADGQQNSNTSLWQKMRNLLSKEKKL